jgi:hypothetical protein
MLYSKIAALFIYYNNKNIIVKNIPIFVEISSYENIYAKEFNHEI